MSSARKSEGWTLEGGYPLDAEKDTYPRRAMSAGTRAGLVILMRAYEQDLDYICRGPVQGFKVPRSLQLKLLQELILLLLPYRFYYIIQWKSLELAHNTSELH